MTNDRFLFPGGFAAALTCLVFLTGCPGPIQPTNDAGVTPMTDSGMPPDEDSGVVDPPDTGMPPLDGGMVGECTPDMMLMRITPPCDPDTRTGAGTGPTGLEGYVGPDTGWMSPGGNCGTGQSPDMMSRIGLLMRCTETNIDPYMGLFYLDLDGLWYANWQNRATQEHARMSFDIHPMFGPQSATIELFHAGEDTPYQTVTVFR